MGVGGKVLQLGAEAVIEGGQQFLKRMGKAKTLPKLSGITADTLVKHVDANKGVDIPDIETMFKGMVNGDEASYTAFDEFSSTTMVANKYQDNVSSYERAREAADLSWVGDRKSSELNRTGMRKNVLDFGYSKRAQDPNIPPSEISQSFQEEMGTISYGGEPQKIVSGGSKPTKTGQRRLAVQDVAENKARRQKNIKERNEHGYTSPEAKKSYNKQNKEVAAENKQAVKDAKAQGIKVKPGQQFVSLEHDIALSHGKKWWKKVGNIGNDPDNLFIQRNQLARQFKDNIENWFYPKSKDFVIKSDRSNLKDLIIMSVETGQEVLRIPMPDDFATGIPDNITQQLKELICK
jgi:hypothetical protein